ncbi:hypothetical protein ACFL5O_01930 [Myxococcota bacterium]
MRTERSVAPCGTSRAFSADDRSVLFALIRGEHTIPRLRHANLQRQLPRLTSVQVSRNLKRVRVHGLIQRVGRRYQDPVTQLGQRTAAQPKTLWTARVGGETRPDATPPRAGRGRETWESTPRRHVT